MKALECARPQEWDVYSLDLQIIYVGFSSMGYLLGLFKPWF